MPLTFKSLPTYDLWQQAKLEIEHIQQNDLGAFFWDYQLIEKSEWFEGMAWLLPLSAVSSKQVRHIYPVGHADINCWPWRAKRLNFVQKRLIVLMSVLLSCVMLGLFWLTTTALALPKPAQFQHQQWETDKQKRQTLKQQYQTLSQRYDQHRTTQKVWRQQQNIQRKWSTLWASLARVAEHAQVVRMQCQQNQCQFKLIAIQDSRLNQWQKQLQTLLPGWQVKVTAIKWLAAQRHYQAKAELTLRKPV